MRKKLLFIAALCALAIGVWILWKTIPSSVSIVVPKVMNLESVSDTDYVAPPVVHDYKNDKYRFSLKMPEGFNDQDLGVDESGAHTMVLQNEKGEGIQIYITPNEGGAKRLTANDVRASIPDMKVTGEQEVEIGPDNRGVAFISDNEAFGGASREVWFYFRGNLYQISTYARLDSLLQAMFSTWKFF